MGDSCSYLIYGKSSGIGVELSVSRPGLAAFSFKGPFSHVLRFNVNLKSFAVSDYKFAFDSMLLRFCTLFWTSFYKVWEASSFGLSDISRLLAELEDLRRFLSLRRVGL